MPLVDYSDSDDDDDDDDFDTITSINSSKGTKRKRPSRRKTSTTTATTASSTAPLPPLPDTFHNLYASTTRLSSHDDPSFHNGRQRQTPHVEGNWPTHVYIEWFPSTEQSSRLQEIVDRLADTEAEGRGGGGGKRRIHTLVRSPLGAELPLHISLSCPITLKADERQPFLQSLTRKIDRSSVMPFSIRTSSSTSLEWHPNHDQSRHFLVLSLEQRDAITTTTTTSSVQLLKLLHASNIAAAEVGQPPLIYSMAMTKKRIGHEQKKKKNDNDKEDQEGKAQWKSEQGSGTEVAKAQNGSYSPVPVNANANANAEVEVEKGESSSSSSSSQESEATETLKSLHISLAWTLTLADCSTSTKRLEEISTVNAAFTIKVDNVKVKMGNSISVIPLTEKRDCSNGIIGR